MNSLPTIGLRGRLIMLLLAAFAALAGLGVWHASQDRIKQIRSASDDLLDHAKLIAARQQAIASQADVILTDLMLIPELGPGASAKECSQILAVRFRQAAQFDQIVKALPNGDVACAAVAPKDFVNFADRNWFREALKSESMVIGDLVIGRISDKPLIPFAKAIRGNAGQVSGVFMLSLDLAWLHKELAKTSLPEGAILEVLDGEGAIAMRHPDPGGSIGEKAVKQPLYQTLLAGNSNGTVEAIGLDGVPRIYASAPLMNTISGQMILSLSVPKEVVNASVLRELMIRLAIELAGLLVTLGATVWCGNRMLVRPLLALSRTATRFGAGDYSVRSGISYTEDEIGRLAWMFDEIAENIQSNQQQLLHTNRALRIISAVNRTTVRTEGEPALIGEMCRVIVEAGGYRMAWVGYAEHDPTKSIRPIASWGIEQDFFTQLKLSWADTALDQSASARAIRQGVPVIVRNTASDPDVAPWRELLQRYGIASAIALPVRVEGATIGALVVSSGEPEAFANEEMLLLSQATDDLSFGIAARRAEEELRLRAMLLDNATDSIFVVDLDGNFTYVNETSWKTRGYTHAELMAMNLRALEAPGYAKIIESRIREMMEQDSSIFESVHRCKDGTLMPVEVSARVIESGSRKLVLAMVRDITERKRQEAVLILQARRTQALLELPQVAEQMDEAAFMQRSQKLAEQVTDSEIAFVYFVSEDQGTLELATQSVSTLERDHIAAADKHYRLSQAGIWADAIRQHAPVMINDSHSESGRSDQPRGLAELKRVISVPVIERGKVVMIVEAGNKAKAYTDLDVESVQLIANAIWRILRDQRAQAQLGKLSLAIEQSPESIVITDLEGRIEYVNEAFIRNSGYSRDEVLGQKPIILHSGKTPVTTYDELWATLTEGNVWQGEFINRRKDGSEFVEFASISPVRQANGRITNYLAVKEDITEKKRIGTELDQHRHHLEALVAQRTVELEAARQAAEAANHAKSAFLASMSHELRTPMNAIIGFSDLLKDGLMGELTLQQRECVSDIYSSGCRLLSLIEDILDLSRAEAGKMTLEPKPSTVPTMLQACLQVVKEKALAHRIKLSADMEEGLGEIWLDERKTKQILYNLLSNALKFTPDGGEVRVVARKVGREAVKDGCFDHYLELEVKDTGIGIAAEDQSRLFQPFTQIDSTLARHYEGTGLGLVMVRRLVELHGGAVMMQSEPDKGSTFTVWLPWRTAGEAPAKETAVLEATRDAS